MQVLNEINFSEVVKDSGSLVVVDFYATWCRPCNVLTPVLERMSKDMPAVVFTKVNTAESPDLANEYQISAIPTILFFKGGELVSRKVGLQPESALRGEIQRLLNG